MIEYILFDFDGVIADTLPISINVVNNLSDKFKLNKIDNPDTYKSMGSRELRKYLKMSFWKAYSIVNDSRKRMRQGVKEAKTFKGIEDMLKRLSENYELGILSSNYEDSIIGFLLHNNIKKYFKDIQGGIGVLSKGKRIKRFLKDKKLKKNQLIYVVNHVRDIKAANKAGVIVIPVSFGYNSRERLELEKPSEVIPTPEQIVWRIYEFNERYSDAS